MHRRSNRAIRPFSLILLLLACANPPSPQPSDGGVSRDGGSDRPAGDGGAGERGQPAGAPPAEECARRQCNASVPDLCCPAPCSGATDIDCAGCGNERLEPGELCDPPEKCATSCPQLKCEKQRLKSEGTCAAVCVSAGTQTRCVDGDECCAEGCTAANDRDCSAMCGNGVVEPGELCDPPSSCAQSCPMQGCTILGVTNPGTCLAHCAPTGMETTCRDDDGCCPPGCTAANDKDCSVQCGNGAIEERETCDPLASCPRECPAQGCRLRRLLNAGTCTAVCVEAGLETECRHDDGCCPVGCNSSNDRDCPVQCGNGVVETGETCDPISSCLDRERACVSDATTARTRMGDPGRCQFVCAEMTRMCGPMDRACPPGCGPTQDPDCLGCGNGVVEANETCDPPTACRQLQQACTSDQSTVRTPSGDPAICTFACRETARPCGPADGACPTGCTAARDPDCVGCGNGMLDPGESCDPVTQCQERSAACVSDRNTVRTGSGDPLNCRFVCRETPRLCGPADGECPSADCGPTRDRDCPGCGNLRVEPGETCDPCDPADVRACVGDDNTIRTPAGDAARCTFACTVSPRPCTSGDGFCPTMCTRATDRDCLAAPGDPCTATSECAMGSCTDSRCCVQSCRVCQSCTGAAGSCANIARGVEDTVPANACTGGSLCDGQGNCQAPPCQLRLEPNMVNFGTVMLGSSSTAVSVIVRNPCNVALPPPTITSTSGEFRVQSHTCQAALPAGGTCTLNLLFTPRAEGVRSATLTATAAGGGTASAALTGTGQAPSANLVFKPTRVVFPTTLIGSGATENVTLNNIGSSDSGVISLSVTNNPAGDLPFMIGQHGCTRLAPQASCPVSLIFRPRATGGATGTLNASSASGASASATLSGTGTALAFSPTSHAFGTVPVQTRVTASFKLVSSVPISGLEYAITGTNASEFRLAETSCPPGGTISPTSGCSVTVVFTPGSAGAKMGQVRASGTEAGTTARRHEAVATLTGTGG